MSVIEGRFPAPQTQLILTDAQRRLAAQRTLQMVQGISSIVMQQNPGLRKMASMMASAGITFLTTVARKELTPDMARTLGNSKVPALERIFMFLNGALVKQIDDIPLEDKAMADHYAFETYKMLQDIFE